MKKLFSLFIASLFSVAMFAEAQGGTLTASPALTDPSATVVLTYDGAGTNFANWQPECFIHAWLVPAKDQSFSKAYETKWVDCDGSLEGVEENRKMAYAGKEGEHDGKYTISMNIKEFFGVADEDLAKIAQLGVIVCSQYNKNGDDNKTKDFLLAVGESGEGEGEGEGGGEEVKTKDLKLVPGVWDKDGAVLAAWAWSKEVAGAWAKFEGSEAPFVAKINEKADSVIFVRFKDGIEPTWEDQKTNIWNKTEDLLIDECGIFYVNDWDKYSWCKADEEGGEGGEGGEGEETKTKDLKLVPGVWDKDGAVLAVWAWSKEVAGAWAKFEGSEAPFVAKINEKADSVIFVRFKDGIEPTWEDQETNIWNKTANMKIEDCGIFYVNDWDKYSWCEADEGGEGGEGEETKTKDLKLVPGVWDKDGAVLAVWAWSKEVAGAWAKFAGSEAPFVAKINEKADSVIIVRFKDGIEPTWEDQETNIWNKTADMKIEYCGIFYVNDWDKYSWCEADEGGEGGGGEEAKTKDLKLVPGVWTTDGAVLAVWAWKGSDAGAWVKFEGAEAPLVAKIAADADHVIFVRFKDGIEPTWDDQETNIWNKTEDLELQDCGIFYVNDWDNYSWCEAESGEGIDNTVVEAVAVKTIENGMLIIEKAGVRYNVMGQVVR